MRCIWLFYWYWEKGPSYLAIKALINGEKFVRYYSWCAKYKNKHWFVIDGWYNWSDNAKYREEHIIIIESKKVAKFYKENFDRLMNEVIYDDNSIRSVG